MLLPVFVPFKGIGQMLAIAISLLFGLAAFSALAVIYASTIRGVRSARWILAELENGTRRPARPINPQVWRPAPTRQLQLAAA